MENAPDTTSVGKVVTYTNPQGQNVLNRLRDFITNVNRKKMFALAGILILVAGAIFAVGQSNVLQDIRQRADFGQNLLTTPLPSELNHDPSSKQVVKWTTPTFSPTTISGFTVNGRGFNYGTPETNVKVDHDLVSINSTSITINHDMGNYQRYQYLPPSTIGNDTSGVALTLNGNVNSTPYLGGPFPTFARLQIENKDTSEVYAYIEPNHAGPQRFTVPAGVTLATTIRVLNTRATFSGVSLTKDVAPVETNIWASTGVFHNADDDSNRPNLSSGTITLDDNPQNTQALNCFNANTNTSYKVSATVAPGNPDSGLNSPTYPTYAGIAVDELNADCTYAGKSHGKDEEFTPQSPKIGINFRALNNKATFSNIAVTPTAYKYTISGGAPTSITPIISGITNPATPGYVPYFAKTMVDVWTTDNKTNTGSNTMNNGAPLTITVKQGEKFAVIARVINASATFGALTIKDAADAAVDAAGWPTAAISDFPALPAVTTGTITKYGPYQANTKDPITLPVAAKYHLQGKTEKTCYVEGANLCAAWLQADVYNVDGSGPDTYVAPADGNQPMEFTVPANYKLYVVERVINAKADFSGITLTQELVSAGALTSTVNIPATTEYKTGETVTLTFNATGGSGGPKIIHTTLKSGVTSETEAKKDGFDEWAKGYVGFDLRQSGAKTKTATIPFYVEYLAEDVGGNKEAVHKLLILAKPVASTMKSTCSADGTKATLTWDAVAGAGKYQLRIDKFVGKPFEAPWDPGNNSTTGDIAPVVDQNSGATAQTTTVDVTPGAKYFWVVQTLPSGQTTQSYGELRSREDGGEFTCSGPAATATPPVTTNTPPPPTATPTLQPTATPIITQPPPPGAAVLWLAVKLSGIGSGLIENATPVHPQKNVTVEIFDTADKSVFNKTFENRLTIAPAVCLAAALPGAGNTVPQETIDCFIKMANIPSETKLYPDVFFARLDVIGVPEGNYTIKVSSPGYLRRLITGIHHIVTPGKNIGLPIATLIAGDLNNDNKLDIEDYNIYRGCYGKTIAPESKVGDVLCSVADINDDGKIDSKASEKDYRLLINSFSTQSGD